jgi:putative transposase
MKTSDLTTYRRKLPHWRMEGCIYFVTWRLAKNQPAVHPEKRTIVENAVKYFDSRRYELLAYVVMDDHAHVLVLPLANYSLQQILHSWKSFTAKEMRRTRKRSIPVWQD